MKAPLTRCSVPETAMARTRGAVSAKSFSGSFGVGELDQVERAGEPA